MRYRGVGEWTYEGGRTSAVPISSYRRGRAVTVAVAYECNMSGRTRQNGWYRRRDLVPDISEAGFLMLRMLITVTTLFFITIAAITNSTGGGI